MCKVFNFQFFFSKNKCVFMVIFYIINNTKFELIRFVKDVQIHPTIKKEWEQPTRLGAMVLVFEFKAKELCFFLAAFIS